MSAYILYDMRFLFAWISRNVFMNNTPHYYMHHTQRTLALRCTQKSQLNNSLWAFARTQRCILKSWPANRRCRSSVVILGFRWAIVCAVLQSLRARINRVTITHTHSQQKDIYEIINNNISFYCGCWLRLLVQYINYVQMESGAFVFYAIVAARWRCNIWEQKVLYVNVNRFWVRFFCQNSS